MPEIERVTSFDFATPEHAIELFGEIPTVTSSFVVNAEQVPEDLGHVPPWGQDKIYFDEAIRVLRAKGLWIDSLAESGIHVSTGGNGTNYLRDLHVGEEVVIATDIIEQGKQLRFDQRMNREGKDISSHWMSINYRNYRKAGINAPLWVSEKLRTPIDQPSADPASKT